MASVQKGTVGVAWSLVTGATATGMGTFTVQGADYSIESELKEIKGADGAVKTIIHSNARETLTLDVIPSGATIALAKAANVMPAIGADVAVTDADDTELVGAAGTSNRWHFVSGQKRKTIDGEVRLTFNLVRYETDLPTIAAS